MAKQKLPQEPLPLLKAGPTSFVDKEAWQNHLNALDIKAARHVQVASEAALVGSVLAHGFPIDLKIVSDDAGQFNLFQHALCWLHAERTIKKLIPWSKANAHDLDKSLTAFWDIYASLKAYKLAPTDKTKKDIEKKFDKMCSTKTSYTLLNKALRRLYTNRDELLLVLKYPELPLHNNLSERDIREYVKKRKISGSSRSNEGRKSRDTFASLRKTCLKPKVNFWDFLLDRHSKTFSIPYLPTLIHHAANST